MQVWAQAHAWAAYVRDRDTSHAPYSSESPLEHAGLGFDLIVLPHGGATCCLATTTLWAGCCEEGIVFTTERLIVGNIVTAIHGAGARGVAVKCDGTYKIGYEGGWNLFAIGTHAVVWNQQSFKNVHTFRPFCFAYIKAESNNTLRDFAMPALLHLTQGGRPPRTVDC